MKVFRRRVPLLAPLSLLVAGSFLGLRNAYDPGLSLSLTLSLWVGAVLFVAIVALCRSAAAAQRLAALLVVAASLGALLFFLQYRHMGFERKIGLITRIGELTSAPFPLLIEIPFQQNMAAAYLEGALPIALGLWRGWPGRLRQIWLACALLIGAGVVLTASRGAWVALAVCAAAALAIGLGRRRPRLLAGLLAGGAALASVGGLLLLFSPLGAGLVERAESRLDLYRTTLPLAFDTIFTGIGMGEPFAMIYARYGLLIQVPYLTYAHNLPLAIWLGGGILALLGLLLLIVEVSGRCWRAGRAGAGPLWLGAALGSLALLLHGLVDAPQYNTGWYTMLMSWAVLGLALATGESVQKAKDKRPSAGQATATPDHNSFAQHPAPYAPRPTPAAGRPSAIGYRLSAIGLALVIGLAVGWRPLAAQFAVNMGAIAEARADLAADLSKAERAVGRAAAADWYRQALVIDPGHGSAARRLGVQALNAQRFAEAIDLLEAARRSDLAGETIGKALGYAYLWAGRIDPAVELFQQLDRRAEVRAELDTYAWWWAAEGGRPDLAEYAAAAAQQLGD